jgi:hypothetical protein
MRAAIQEALRRKQPNLSKNGQLRVALTCSSPTLLSLLHSHLGSQSPQSVKPTARQPLGNPGRSVDIKGLAAEFASNPEKNGESCKDSEPQNIAL